MIQSHNSTETTQAPAIVPGGNAERALAALADARAKPTSPPYGNTGGTLRQSIDPEGEKRASKSPEPVQSATNCPPVSKRKGRAKKTTPALENWLRDAWFFDWITLTPPNEMDGKGSRRRASPSEIIEAGRLTGAERIEAMSRIHYEDRLGEEEARKAVVRLCLWAVLNGLHQQRVGNGTDGFAGSLHYAESPVAPIDERRATIKAGHSSNMPCLEISGGDGACARLAPLALDNLGPMLLARADVSMDHSQEGLLDALLDYAHRMAKASKMGSPRTIETDTGRTFYWGKGEASVKVYQKDLERVADGKMDLADADPHLVRIEFRFSPKSNKKAGAAALAKRGPSVLLGTVHWVRQMVEHIAVLIGATEKGDKMAVQRVITAPDGRTPADKAGHGLAQYAGTFCNAALSKIVAERFGGDWLAAEADADEVRAVVLDMVAAFLDASGAPEAAVSRTGLDKARDAEAEAERGAAVLDFWMARQRRAADDAKDGLTEAATAAAFKAGQTGDGVPSSGSGEGAAAGVAAGAGVVAA